MLPDPLSAEILSASGADWICIDLQHGLIGDEAMRLMVAAAAIRKTPVIVRAPWNEPSSIMRALDAGADGVIVPMVNTEADACAAAAATRFPPLGNRSWGPLRPAMTHAGFSPVLGNDLAICLVMVETAEAVENLDAIAGAPGVDGVFVGPKDLSISLTGEVGGPFSSARSAEVVGLVAEACRSRGLIAGTICDTAEEMRRCQELGYSLISVPPDAVLLGAAMRAELEAARA
jgi:4-hydroxy-2-oxoheptanedioate aldolase